VATGRLLDRTEELARLEQAWRTARRGRAQLVVVWGRRRVGKTFLLSHFVRARGRRSVFFGATEQAEGIELGRLAEAVRRDLGDRVADLAGGAFASWEAALRFFVALAAREPLTVVLDEVPYLARSTAGFPSIVQAVWDRLPRGTKLLLVLTGSAIGTVEAMLGAHGPLRGRPTETMRLDPLDPWRARAFLPGLAPGRFLEAYAACGGYPLHLAAWDSRVSTETNLQRLAGTPGGILLEDATGILSEELSETAGYARILGAIGRGRTRYAEIAGEAGQRVEYPLEVLARSGFVMRVTPVGAPRGARPIYTLGDVYLAFWFRVLYSELPLIEGGQGAAILLRARPRWQAQLGQVFEEVARAHASRLVERGRLPADLVIGRWWTTGGEPCEVDVMGLRGRRAALLGEARWQERPLDVADLDQLRLKTVRVPHPVEEPTYALWGRSGITEAARRAGALGFDAEAILDG